MAGILGSSAWSLSRLDLGMDLEYTKVTDHTKLSRQTQEMISESWSDHSFQTVKIMLSRAISAFSKLAQKPLS